MIYVVATHTGTLLLFALFATWAASTSDLSFAALASRPPFSAGRGGMILILAPAARPGSPTRFERRRKSC